MRAQRLVAQAVVGLAGFAAVAGAVPSTSIVGGSAPQRSVLRQILAGLGSNHIQQLRIVPVVGGVKLQTPADGIRPSWEAIVVGAAFLDRSRALGLPPLLEVDAGPAGWPTSNISAAEPPRATPSAAAATRRTMLRLAAASGARVAELTVSTPDALAVALRLRVGNAAAFLHHRLRALVLNVRRYEARYEGLYLEIDDGSGNAWASAEARLGGLEHVRPGLLGCDPFPPPGPRRPVPPCPA